MQKAIGKVTGNPKTDVGDLTGRVALVTGGALGIGYEISRTLALAHARVIMVNRKEEQGEQAIAKIKEEYADADLEWIGCDLGNLQETKDVFDRIKEKEKRLDLLICSAGINTNKYDVDSDNIDRHFGVNWLGHFLAINRLYPLLRATSRLPNTPPPRIVFESSKMHQFAPPSEQTTTTSQTVQFSSLEEINDPNLTPTQLYGRTKLAMILGAKFGLLQRVIEPNQDNIYVLAVHPGTVSTDMQEQWKEGYGKLLGSALSGIMYAVGRSPQQGSVSAVWAATSEEVEHNGWNGAYFEDPGMLGGLSDDAKDAQLGENLWELSHNIVKDKLGADALLPWNA